MIFVAQAKLFDRAPLAYRRKDALLMNRCHSQAHIQSGYRPVYKPGFILYTRALLHLYDLQTLWCA